MQALALNKEAFDALLWTFRETLYERSARRRSRIQRDVRRPSHPLRGALEVSAKFVCSLEELARPSIAYDVVTELERAGTPGSVNLWRLPPVCA